MAQWAVIIEADRWATERLFRHDTLAVPELAGQRPATGDDVLVVAAGPRPQVVASGTVGGPDGAGGVLVSYTRRAFDAPAAADGLRLDQPVTPIATDLYRRLTARLGPATGRRSWLVSLDLPIEAESPAEAVRQFWSYVRELGPQELPTFVSPSGDELNMQAFVLGRPANQDPEEDADDD